jgi:hypothetical protein
MLKNIPNNTSKTHGFLWLVLVLGLGLGMTGPVAISLGQDPGEVGASADAGIPTAHNLQRYSTLWQRNPFVLEVVVDTPEPEPSAFDDLAIVGVYSAGDLSIATVYDQKANERFVVTNKPLPGDKFVLQDIQMGTSLGDTVVQLKNQSGSQVGRVTGSESAVKAMRAKQPSRPQARGRGGNNRPAPPTPGAKSGGDNKRNAPRRVIRPRTISPPK